MIGAKRLSSFLGLDARHYPVAGRRDKVVITLSGSERTISCRSTPANVLFQHQSCQ